MGAHENDGLFHRPAPKEWEGLLDGGRDGDLDRLIFGALLSRLARDFRHKADQRLL